MRGSRRSLSLALFVGLAVIAGWLAIGPLMVVGAPPLQGVATPRPTIGPPTSTHVATPVVRKVGVALVVDKAKAHPGDSLRYQLQVTNITGQKATNVWLTCDLPEGITIDEYSTTKGAVHRYGQRLSVEMGEFQPSFESYYIEIKTHINDDIALGTELIHHANLTSDQAGGGERDASTISDAEAKTLVTGEEAQPTAQAQPTKETQKAGTLPVTGSKGISVWIILGFLVIIVAAALIGNKERINLSN